MTAEHTVRTVALFDGSTLDGWHSVPRLPVAPWPGGPAPDTSSAAYQAAAAATARWEVVDGAIVGFQDPPGSGFGGYLVTDETFADFQLTFEVRPDWPADTGVMLRATGLGSQGFQVLVDHRKSGGIAGFFGNGIGSFHALAFGVDIATDASGAPVELVEEDPTTTIEEVTPNKVDLLTYAATADEFFDAWRWDDWNEISVRCVGRLPVLTTWVNGVRMYELDAAAIAHPHYDGEAVATLLGRAGHIALEVHDNDPGIGRDRWGLGAAVRWRNIRLDVLDEASS